jgi:hypothetical protein
MTNKCQYYRECTSWEQDSLCCSYFYNWCKAYKGYELERQQKNLQHSLRNAGCKVFEIPEVIGKLNPDGSPRTRGLDSLTDTPEREGAEI